MSPINVQQGLQQQNPGIRQPVGPRMMQHAAPPSPRNMQQLPTRYARPMMQRMSVSNGPMMNVRMPNGQIVNGEI